MKAAQAGNQCAGAFGNDNQNAHVAVDALAHLRAPDLHDHVLSVAQGGAMDLGDRGSGERFALECPEDLVKRASQGAVQLALGLLRRERPGMLAQVPQLPQIGLREEVWPHAEGLADLEEGRAKIVERLAQVQRQGRRIGADAATALAQIEQDQRRC